MIRLLVEQFTNKANGFETEWTGLTSKQIVGTWVVKLFLDMLNYFTLCYLTVVNNELD